MSSVFVKTGVASLGVLHTLNRNVNTETGTTEVIQFADASVQSCGGVETSAPVKSFDFLLEKQLINLLVEDIFEEEEGEMVIRPVDTDNAAYISPTSGIGAAVEVEYNESLDEGYQATLSGGGADHAVIVSRIDSRGLNASRVDEFKAHIYKPYNNAIAHGDLTEAERAAGKITTRTIVLKNRNEEDLQKDTTPNDFTRLSVSIHGVGTPFNPGVSQLANSGAGSARGAAGCVDDWADSGWALIVKDAPTAASLLVDSNATILAPTGVCLGVSSAYAFVAYQALFGVGGGIMRFNADGTSPSSILTGNNITAVTFSETEQKVIYKDSVTGEIRRCDFDGTNDALVIAATTTLWLGASKLSDRIYWNDTNGLQTCLQDGTEYAVLSAITTTFRGGCVDPIRGGVFYLEDAAVKWSDSQGNIKTVVAAVSGVTASGLAFNPFNSTFYTGDSYTSADALWRFGISGAAELVYEFAAGVDVIQKMRGIWYDAVTSSCYGVSLDGANDKLYKIPVSFVREVVYYSAKLSDGLAVTHRGLLKTTNSAGAATDTIYPFSPIIMRAEEFTAGLLTEPTDENDIATLSGDDFYGAEAYEEGAGLWCGTLAPMESIGLHMRRVISASHSSETPITSLAGSPRMEINLRARFYVGNTGYTRFLCGCYRIASDSLTGYIVDAGETSTVVVASLPANIDPFALTAETLGEHAFPIRVRLRNKYGLISQNIYTRTITLDLNDPAATLVTDPPNPPFGVQIRDAGSGMVSVFVEYAAGEDPDPADKVRVHYTNDGTTATASSAYEDVALTASAFASLRPGIKTAIATLGAFMRRTDVSVFCTSYRTSDTAESATGVSESITVTSMGLQSVTPYLRIGNLPQHLERPDFTEVEQILYSGAFDVAYRMRAGVSILEVVGGSEIWRLRYDSSDPYSRESNGLQVTGSWQQLHMPTAYPSTQADLFTFDAGTATLRFAAGGYPRLVTDGLGLYFSAIKQWRFRAFPDCVPDGTGVQAFGDYVSFPVYDRATRRFVNVMTVTFDGVLYTKVPYIQDSTGAYK